MSKRQSNQDMGMLFEDNYLLRTHRQLTSSADIAFAELVANAWDAGAFRVDINIDENESKVKCISIQDDGAGMTLQKFQDCWRTLAYDRVRRQETNVVFPSNKKGTRRQAFGRNGVGRHGLLCFADSYIVNSKTETSAEFSYKVSLGSGVNPLIFEELEVKSPSIFQHGTRLFVQVERNFTGRKNILQSLSRRFLYDPQFTICVNNESVRLEDLKNRLETFSIRVSNMSLEMTILNAIDMEPGIAFWQGGRLVGQPSWILGNDSVADKRTRSGKDYSVIVKTNDLAEYIHDDWSGFRIDRIDELQPLFDAVKEHFTEYCRTVNQTNYASLRNEFKEEFSDQLRTSSTLVQVEFDETLREVLVAHPTASKAMIKTVLETVVQLGQKRGGAELLQKLSSLEGEDVEKLNGLLKEWEVRDICVVLDEIDKRIRTIDAIAKLSADKSTPELSVLHPLVTEARWLFGPEFDSPEYTSNQWLSTTAKKVFKNQADISKLTVPQKRADLVILEDYTVSLTGTDHFDPEYSSVSLIDRILLIELKKGASEINRNERSQLVEYAEEIYAASPRKGISITGFVVGHNTGQNITDQSACDGKVNIYVRTFSHLVDSARKRLFNLRKRLHEHYDNLPDNRLYQGLLPD